MAQITSSGGGAGAEPESTRICAPDLDDFSQKLTADDARSLVDMLKLAVAKRAGERGKEALTDVLTALGKTYPQVGKRKPTPVCF
ncbi:hypothetical protein NP493_1668g00001 [Ridgeia piscesae]|uniref:Uncharacterized protein n=1 Tax=Ridgeia piscesae TaxID=27915 RepID=A0AAD9JX27_RIDPI|nr:hypothetical protein NP493_1668g00001 [Ridgeia piscesae]